MANEFLDAITAWPALLQAVTGSAIFWLVLLLGQKVAVHVNAKYSESSKKRRKDFLLEQRLKYYYKTTTDNVARGVVFSALTYRGFRNFLRASIWMTLGFLGGSFISILGVIGFIGALYYLFAALNTVTPVSDESDPSAKLKQLSAEIERLDQV